MIRARSLERGLGMEKSFVLDDELFLVDGDFMQQREAIAVAGARLPQTLQFGGDVGRRTTR